MVMCVRQCAAMCGNVWQCACGNVRQCVVMCHFPPVGVVRDAVSYSEAPSAVYYTHYYTQSVEKMFFCLFSTDSNPKQLTVVFVVSCCLCCLPFFLAEPIMHYELTQLGRVPMASPPRAAFQATPASASPRATSWVPHSSLLLSPLSSLLIPNYALCIMH